MWCVRFTVATSGLHEHNPVLSVPQIVNYLGDSSFIGLGV
jgi:hypothetical protein